MSALGIVLILSAVMFVSLGSDNAEISPLDEVNTSEDSILISRLSNFYLTNTYEARHSGYYHLSSGWNWNDFTNVEEEAEAALAYLTQHWFPNVIQDDIEQIFELFGRFESTEWVYWTEFYECLDEQRSSLSKKREEKLEETREYISTGYLPPLIINGFHSHFQEGLTHYFQLVFR